MASPFTLIFYHHDSIQASQVANQCFNLVDSFVLIFSDYLAESELTRLNNTAGSGKFVPVSTALFDIILQSQQAYKMSRGSFDITMGPIIRLWRKARKEKQFPAQGDVAAVMKKVGFNKVAIDNKTRSVKLLYQGMQLDLGGIAQGYIAQKVLERLAENNIKSALVDVSGDITTGDPPPGRKGWTIGINLPASEELQRNHLMLNNLSVSTSGDLYQYLEHNGKKYSHIIDPKTGYGISTQKNVTIIAKNATVADWLSTACSILPVRKSKRLAVKMHAELLVAQMKNNRIRYFNTKNTSYFYVLNKE